MKKIALFTAAALLASTSLTLAQQPATSPKSVKDMLAMPPQIGGMPTPVMPVPVIKKPVAVAPVAPVVQPAKPPAVVQPVVAPPVVAAPVQMPAPTIVPPAEPVAIALPEPTPVENVTPPVEKTPESEVAAVAATDTVQLEEKSPADTAEEDIDFSQELKIPAEMKKSLENDFKDKLKFPMTEQKLVAFIRAGQKVEAINSRWDVEIAAAESDKIAMENNNFAVEDIKASLSSLKDLTIDEYNELSLLSTVDENFVNLVTVYRDLLKQGVKIEGEDSQKKADRLKMADRMDAVQSQIQTLQSEIKAKQEAMANPALAQTTAATDPLLAAQLDALTAKAQQIADRINAINQRAASIEKQVKTN